MTLLQVRGLDAGYETGQVLFDVDLDVDSDEVVSLLGRNGAGKTTTLRAIVGADEPSVQRGTIEFDGTDLREMQSHEISDVGLAFVPEERRCFRDLTVAENVRLAANHAPDPRDVEEVFDRFPELDDMRERRAKNTSGGEQQMLAIARALVADPEMILLDEPCEGLAPYVVRRIEELVEEISETEGVTMLLVEQNVAVALAVADRHYLIDEGSIVDEVTSERLREDEELRQQYLGV